MARTALLLLLIGSPPEVDWWRRLERTSLCRAVFDCWWEGATTAVLLPARATAGGLPVPVERRFACGESAGLPASLRFWLLMRRAAKIVVAGPGASAIASRLGPRARALETPGQPVDATNTPQTDGLVLRIV